MNPKVIEIRELRVEQGERCLIELPALTVHPGERVALVGPNGAGKSSLLKVVGGFLRASQGSVTVLGHRMGPADAPATSLQWRHWRAEVGQVMQGLHMVPRLTALENVVLGALARSADLPRWRSWLRWYPMPLRQEASAALADLGLGHRLHTRADQLSGGERQKVGLARLRLQRPRLILADEPTAALDPGATQQACRTLLALAQEATLLTVVHDPSLLPLLADRVIGLSQGRLVFDLPLAELDSATLERLYAGAQEARLSPTLSAHAAALSPEVLRTERPLPA
jgi:phosphonate transport system ATP-binding protein